MLGFIGIYFLIASPTVLSSCSGVKFRICAVRSACRTGSKVPPPPKIIELVCLSDRSKSWHRQSVIGLEKWVLGLMESCTLHSIKCKLLKLLDADLEWWRFSVEVESSRVGFVIIGSLDARGE